MKKYVILISGVAVPGGLLVSIGTVVIPNTFSALKNYQVFSGVAIGLVIAAASIGYIPVCFLAESLRTITGGKRGE